MYFRFPAITIKYKISGIHLIEYFTYVWGCEALLVFLLVSNPNASNLLRTWFNCDSKNNPPAATLPAAIIPRGPD